MDRWKSRGAKSQRREENRKERKKKEDQRESEKIREDQRREREEKRKRRERVRRKSQKKEAAGAPKGRKAANDCVFPMICNSGGSKSRLAKAAGAEPSGQLRDEKLLAIVVRSTF